MCTFASFVLTKSAEYWGPTDSHEEIIAHHNLRDDADRVLIVRVEITPPPDDRTSSDYSAWSFRVDQDTLPEWTFCGDPALEERARAALLRRAACERWHQRRDEQQATVGYAGTATAGDRGTATAGDYGTATAGDRGTATAGDYGTATAGDYGTVAIRWWDGSRYRLAVGYPGEDGIEAGVAYRCDAQGRLVRAEDPR